MMETLLSFRADPRLGRRKDPPSPTRPSALGPDLQHLARHCCRDLLSSSPSR